MHLRNSLMIALCFTLGCGAQVERPGALSDEAVDALPASSPPASRSSALAEDDPILELSELGLFFGQVCGGDTADKVLTIRNTGGGTLTVSALRLTGEGFTMPGRPALPLDIGPGGQRQIRLRFSPGATRLPAFDGTLRIVTNDPAWPVADVVLSGLAIPGSLRILPRQFDFGNIPEGVGRNVNLQVRNDSECPVFIGGSRVSGRLSYTLSVESLPDQVWPGTVGTATVRIFCGGEDDSVEAMMRILDTNNRAVGNAQILGYCNPR